MTKRVYLLYFIHANTDCKIITNRKHIEKVFLHGYLEIGAGQPDWDRTVPSELVVPGASAQTGLVVPGALAQTGLFIVPPILSSSSISIPSRPSPLPSKLVTAGQIFSKNSY